MDIYEWHEVNWADVTTEQAALAREEVAERWPHDELAAALFALTIKADLLHDLCCIPSHQGMVEYTYTPDGNFIARPEGHVGFDVFLGPASEVAKERSAVLFNLLSLEHQAEVLRRLKRQGIPLSAVGLSEQV